MKYSQSHILRIHRTNERNRSTKNVTIFAREKKRFRTSSIVVIHKATFCILNNRSRVLLYYTACSSKTNEIPLTCYLSPLFSNVTRQLLEKFQKNQITNYQAKNTPQNSPDDYKQSSHYSKYSPIYL